MADFKEQVEQLLKDVEGGNISSGIIIWDTPLGFNMQVLGDEFRIIGWLRHIEQMLHGVIAQRLRQPSRIVRPQH